MTEGRDQPPFDFEPDKPGTNARTEAEADIEILRKRGGLFVEAVARTRMPMAVTDARLPGNPIVFANDSFIRLSGYSMNEVLGHRPHFLNGPDTDPRNAAEFREALRRGEDIVVETFQYRKDGSRFFAAVFVSPIADGDGKVIQHFLSYLDITRRVEAEDRISAHAAELEATMAERMSELRQSEERLRLIVENAQDYAIFTTDPAGTVVDWREGAEAVFGYARDEMVGEDCDILFTPEDRESGQPDKERATAAAEGKASDVRWHVRKDGTRVFIDGVSTALRDREGALVGFLKIGQDVTERRKAEDHQKLLLAELQHRVRNSLGVIRSITRRTALNSDSVEEMGAHLEGRIDAFARVQAVVTRNPGAGIDLRTIVEDELLAHAARDGESVRIDGPDVALVARPAETLSLAIHELTSNAVKYGALSSERGRIVVAWSVAGDRLVLDWIECGLAEPLAEPGREGFGSELLRRVVPYELGAETMLDFRPEGFRFTLALPAEGNLHR